jgi:flagellar biosynthesis GTPase FlhF
VILIEKTKQINTILQKVPIMALVGMDGIGKTT